MMLDAIDTTETGRFLELRDALRLLIRDTESIAASPSQGLVYRAWRARLKRVQHLCEIVVYDRGDGRWSVIPGVLASVHQQAGDWLRGFYPREQFLILADMLRQLERHVDDLQHKATGRLGAIYAKPVSGGPLRNDRPVQVIMPGPEKRSPLILP